MLKGLTTPAPLRALLASISDWWNRDTSWWETWVKIVIGMVIGPILLPILILLLMPALVGWILRTLSILLLYPYQEENPSRIELLQSVALWGLVFLSIDWKWIVKLFTGAWIWGMMQLFIDLF
jgi:hypothetical protein